MELTDYIDDERFSIIVNGIAYEGEWSASAKELYYQAATLMQPAEREISIDLDITFLETTRDYETYLPIVDSEVSDEVVSYVKEELIACIEANIEDYLD